MDFGSWAFPQNELQRLNWRRQRPVTGYNGWAIFVRPLEFVDGVKAVHYCLKLYIPVSPEQLQHFGPLLLQAIEPTRCSCVKVAATLEYSCRPDNLIAYFADWGDLAQVAGLLAPKLQSIPLSINSVPFAPRVDGGPLYWGVDLIRRDPSVGNVSWRQRICSIAAQSLMETADWKRRDRYFAALQALETERIDPATWTPMLPY